MQCTVFLCPQLPEDTIKRGAKIEDYTEETNQKQGQDKFHNAHMPGAYYPVHSGRAADICNKRQGTANGKNEGQNSA
jgi:hypothetical protein